MASFTRPLNRPMFLIPPSIDPLSPKNCAMDDHERISILEKLGIDPERPLLLQVSRFDRFKDPIGVIDAFRLVKTAHPELQLALVGGPADDDPEGAEVLHEVLERAGDDPDLRVLHASVRFSSRNQRPAAIGRHRAAKVAQGGLRIDCHRGSLEREARYRRRSGGIALQVHDYQTGFLVHSPAGAAYRIRYLLRYGDKRQRMGATRARVRARELSPDSPSARLLFHVVMARQSRQRRVGGVSRDAER